MPRARRPVLFAHIPKTAGTSLVRYLEDQFGQDRTLRMSLWAHERRRQVALLNGSRDFVHGHVGVALASSFDCRPIVLTLLRDPVERTLSNFWFLQARRPPSGVAEDDDDFGRASGRTLLEFFHEEPEAASRHCGNLQTWFLTRDGIEPRRDLRELGPLDLARARSALRGVDVVGTVESMQPFLLLLALHLGLDPSLLESFPRLNILDDRPRRSDLDAETLAAVEEATSLDRELWGHASVMAMERVEEVRHFLEAIEGGNGIRGPLGSEIWGRSALRTEAEELRQRGTWLEGALKDLQVHSEDLRSALRFENHERSQLETALEETKARLGTLSSRVVELADQLSAIERSRGWRLLQVVRGLIGTRW